MTGGPRRVPGRWRCAGLAPRELVRVARAAASGSPTVFEELSGSARSLRSRGKIQNRERVADLLADPPPRVDEENGSGGPSQLHLLMRTSAAGRRLDLRPSKRIVPGRGAPVPTAARAERRLPRARLADETDDHPGLHIEAHTGDRATGGSPRRSYSTTASVESSPLKWESDTRRIDRARERAPFTGTSGGISSCARTLARTGSADGRQPGGI